MLDLPSTVALPTTDDTKLGKELLQRSLPKRMKSIITDNVVDTINNMADPEFREEFRENLLSLSVALNGFSRVKILDYANAVKFVTFRMSGDSQIDAWVKTFPNRYQRHLDKDTPSKDLYAYASMYSQNALVVALMTQAAIPVHLVNMDVFQEAINVQVSLMHTSKSDTVRQKAAETLITHLKPPEEQKISLDIGIKDSIIDGLRETTRQLAVEHQNLIKSGSMQVQQITAANIIDVGAEEERAQDAAIEAEESAGGKV